MIENEITIRWLYNIIANIQKGNINVLGRGGTVIDDSTAEMTMTFSGKPDASLNRTDTDE